MTPREKLSGKNQYKNGFLGQIASLASKHLPMFSRHPENTPNQKPDFLDSSEFISVIRKLEMVAEMINYDEHINYCVKKSPYSFSKLRDARNRVNDLLDLILKRNCSARNFYFAELEPFYIDGTLTITDETFIEINMPVVIDKLELTFFRFFQIKESDKGIYRTIFESFNIY